VTAQHHPATDRGILTDTAYASGQDLGARQSLYHYQTPRYDPPAIVEHALAGVHGLVADVGCGNGTFLRHLRNHRPDLMLLGLDIAPGILAGVPRPVVVADAQALPLPDRSADAVLAMHMLYHVPDIDTAIDEADRVLKPGGVLIASTNSATDKQELDRLWTRAAGEVLGVPEGPARISLSARFTLEQASARLGRRFSRIRTVQLPGVISVADPEPVVAHLASYRAWADHLGVPFQDTLRRAERIVADTIAAEGAFLIQCLGGILIAHR
jgi:SAM-dependent methyltransferase